MIRLLHVGLAAVLVVLAQSPAAADGDPARGKRAFLKCVSCHSAEPGVHKTGPSLAAVWGREAATVEGFGRYSDALRAADVRWDAETLDAWLQGPQSVVPGTSMRIQAITSSEEREDLIAYLKQLATDGAAAAETASEGGGGMMGDGELEDLSEPEPARQVTSLRYCPDTYTVSTAAGETYKFWEFNLRFKTDSSAKGPPEGTPVLLPEGMRGDRAFVIFATPQEISRFIEQTC
jgi:cytochrome c